LWDSMDGAQRQCATHTMMNAANETLPGTPEPGSPWEELAVQEQEIRMESVEKGAYQSAVRWSAAMTFALHAVFIFGNGGRRYFYRNQQPRIALAGRFARGVLRGAEKVATKGVRSGGGSEGESERGRERSLCGDGGRRERRGREAREEGEWEGRHGVREGRSRRSGWRTWVFIFGIGSGVFIFGSGHLRSTRGLHLRQRRKEVETLFYSSLSQWET